MENYHSARVYDAKSGYFSDNPQYNSHYKKSEHVVRLGLPKKVTDNERYGLDPLETSKVTHATSVTSSNILSLLDMGRDFPIERSTGVLEHMQGRTDIKAYSIVVEGKPFFPFILRPALHTHKIHKNKEVTELSLRTSVFVITPHQIEKIVNQFIQALARGDEHDLMRRTGLQHALFSHWSWSEHAEETWLRMTPQGWLELDNGFLFFRGEFMWQQFLEYLKIPAPRIDERVLPNFYKINSKIETLISQ